MRFSTELENKVPSENITSMTVNFQDPPKAIDLKQDDGFGSFHALASTAPNLRALRCVFQTAESMEWCHSLDLQLEDLNSLERIEYDFSNVYCRAALVQGGVDGNVEHHLRVIFLLKATIFLQLPKLRLLRIVIPWRSPPGRGYEGLKCSILNVKKIGSFLNLKNLKEILLKDGYEDLANHDHRPTIYVVFETDNPKNGQEFLDFVIITQDEWLYRFDPKRWYINKRADV